MKIKKLASMLMVIALAFSLTISAYAEGNDVVTWEGGYQSTTTASATSPEIGVEFDVRNEFSNMQNTDTMGVEIVWETAVLTITKHDEYGSKWNPETLKWEKIPDTVYYDIPINAVKIATISNRSYWDVKVTGVFNSNPELETYLESLNVSETILPKAEVPKDAGDYTAVGTAGAATPVYLAGFGSILLDDAMAKAIESNGLESIGTVTLNFAYTKSEQ